MQAAILRQAPSGRVLGPEFRIRIRDAIKAQTIDAAWQLFSDHEVGSLEPGKLADIVILERNPLEVPVNELSNIRVLETWVNGRRIRPHIPVNSVTV